MTTQDIIDAASKKAEAVAEKLLQLKIVVRALGFLPRGDVEGSVCLVARAYELHTFLQDNDPDYEDDNDFNPQSIRNFVGRAEAVIVHVNKHLSEIKANSHYND